MLNITVPSTVDSHLNFLTFERYGFPAPPNGADAEINDDLILRFEDEEEAVIYAEQLENLLPGLNDKSAAVNLAIGDIIMAIRNDRFVKSYLEEN